MLWSKIKNYVIGILMAVIAILGTIIKFKTDENEELTKENQTKQAEIDIKDFEGEIKDMKAKTLEEPISSTVKPGNLTLSLLLSFIMLGCSKDVIYVHPKLEVLPVVKDINVTVTERGCVCGEDLSSLILNYRTLKRDNKFYRAEIVKLNERSKHE